MAHSGDEASEANLKRAVALQDSLAYEEPHPGTTRCSYELLAGEDPEAEVCSARSAA